MKNKITVIVVLYRSKHLIGRLMVNIEKNIVGVDQILLVDNSDEDLSEFESSTVSVLRPGSNIGYGAAINYGIKHASNELIVALNPDVIIESWEFCLNDLVDCHFIASGKPREWDRIRLFPKLSYDFFRLSLQNLAAPFGFINRLSGSIAIDKLEGAIPVEWISGALVITNKATMRILDGFDEEFFLFYEEVDLCKRACYRNVSRSKHFMQL